MEGALSDTKQGKCYSLPGPFLSQIANTVLGRLAGFCINTVASGVDHESVALRIFVLPVYRKGWIGFPAGVSSSVVHGRWAGSLWTHGRKHS